MTQSSPIPYEGSLAPKEYVGGQGAQVVLGPQAMGERTYYGAQVCSGTNPRKCQDLGDSILLILGSFILLNIGINVLWRHLKSSLRILFHHFFPKDKQHSCTGSRPTCVRYPVTPKILCSKASPRFRRHSSCLLGHPHHLDSCTADMNDEKVAGCCWVSPPCGHTRAPWRLRKEGMTGAGEAPQVPPIKGQGTFLSKQPASSQFAKISKLDRVPLHLPQESKTKNSNCAVVQAPAQTHHRCPIHTQPPQYMLSNPSTAQLHQQPPSQAQLQPPVHPPEHTPSHISPEHALENTFSQTQGHSPDLAPEHTPAQAQLQIPAPTEDSVCSLGHTPKHLLVHAPCLPAPYANLNYTQVYTGNTAPTFAPAPASTSVPVTNSAPAPTPTRFPISALNPALPLGMTLNTTLVPTPGPATTATPISTPTSSTQNACTQGTSTGHMVYNVCSVKQNFSKVCPTKDLGNLSGCPAQQQLMNSGPAEQTEKPHQGDSAKPSAGSILGYLELGNMEWKISNDAEDKLLQPKTFPYCSFHPCSSERSNAESQVPAYPKFLVFSKDATPSQPCFHSPTNTQSSQYIIPPPCTLSLPLVSPKSFVPFYQLTNQQKFSTSIQSTTFLPTSSSPQCSPSSNFSTSPQCSAVSQSPAKSQCSEPHEGLGLTQDPCLQKTPGPSEDSSVSRNSGLTQILGLSRNPGPTQDRGIHKNLGLMQNIGLPKNPGLTQDPHLSKSLKPSQDSALHKKPIITQDSDTQKSLSSTQDVGIIQKPCLTQPSNHHKDTSTPQTSDIKSSGFIQDSSVHRNLKQNQETIVYKNQDLSETTDLHNNPDSFQDSGGCKSTGNTPKPGVSRSLGFSQDSDPQKYPGPTRDSGVNKSVGLSQECDLHKSAGLHKGSILHKGSNFHQSSGPTQDSGDYKNLGLPQDSDHCKNPGLTKAAKDERRLSFAQEVGKNRHPEHTQDPSFHKFPGINQQPSPHKDLAPIQDSGLPKTLGLTQELRFRKDSHLIPNPDSHRNAGLVLATESVQVLGPPQAPKSTQSLMKPFVSKEASWKERAEQPLPWRSVPFSETSCSPKTQMICNGLQTFSEVPVLIELQPPSSRRAGSQDWVYRPLDTVSSAYQNYRQMSMPHAINWKPYYAGPSTRVGHMVFDARQRQFGVGRDKCEALSPRRFRLDTTAINSTEATAWGHQCVMRALEKEGKKE
ncbi:uncharacterized protein SPEM3 isoform X2 [Erinaceus europaeus]|uniref:Uncharacterized protein SPEM3 isoform X2 n=1 Tax=Erinaceus europaeus TaxID=9365 RepID=A0ABM3YGU0_ERIEU|nr:uncharacterized protein SPEM3 isoform X2 [Erinaceus europaeus]